MIKITNKRLDITMIKAIFFDIDGTLLSFKTHKVSQGTIEAFKILKEKGIKTFISTGRPKIIIPEMPIQFDGYITTNGGYCLVGDRVIYKAPIPKEDSRKWLLFAKEHKLVTFSITADKMFGNRSSEIAIAIHKQLDFPLPPIVDEETILNEEFYQFIGVIPASEDDEIARILPGCDLPRWHPQFTDIVLKGGSKATGIEHIINHFGIKREETMAFGDGGNDIEMLKYVEIGVAMGNASQEVKDCANHTTSSVDEEGIFNALKQFEII